MDEQRARAEELQSIAEQLGLTINALARRLGIEESNFRRYARIGETGRVAPDSILFKARSLAGDVSIDDFIVGYGDTSDDRYVVHTGSPRFIALMGARDKIARVVWLDREPSDKKSLMAMAEKASRRGYHRDYHSGASV